MSIWNNAKFWYDLYSRSQCFGWHGGNVESMIRFDCEGIRHVMTIDLSRVNGGHGTIIRFNLMNHFDFVVTFRTYVGDRHIGTTNYYHELPEFLGPPRFKLLNEHLYTMEDVEHIMTVAILLDVFNVEHVAE